MKATSKRRRPRRSARLVFERLEDRTLLAGNVAASISGGNLRIFGDALDNQVLVERAGATQVRLTPLGDTTVNGSEEPVTLGGFRRGITLNAGGGDDEFQFAGDETANFQIFGTANLNMGSGNDTLEFNGFRVSRALSISTGDGDDQILAGDGVTAGSGLAAFETASISTGAGSDTVQLANTYFAKHVSLNAGSGDDEVDLRAFFHRSAILVGGPGFDTLNTVSTFRQRPVILQFEERTSNSAPPAENEPPTITAVADVTTTINTATAPISVTVADDTTAAGSITLTGASSNTTLVPSANIAITGTTGARTVVVTPAAGQTGTATITLTATDTNGLTATETFFVTVNAAANTSPTISDVANVTVNEDVAAGPFNVTVGDDLTAAGSLNLTATSSNTTLVPNANITLGGSGATRTVLVTPAAGASGTATITLTVTDANGLTATDTFTVTVNAVNDNPTISAVADVTTNINTQAGPLNVTIADQETAAGSLTLSATSNNQAVVADNGITLGGSAGARTVTVAPVTGATGTATITLTVSDGSGGTATETFVVTVNANPTISDVANATVNEDVAAGPFNITVGDDLTAAGSLNLTATSSNTSLVPDANITLAGSGATRTVLVTPLANASGMTTITLTLTDAGELTATDTFTVTVNAVNDPPVGALDPFDVQENSGAVVSGNVLTNDNNGGDGGALAVTALSSGTVGSPVTGQFGAFQVNADGSFTYDLDDTIAAVDQLLAGQELFDELTYTLSDGTDTATAILRIRIQGAAG
jgi:VCBS repeat-containing protein